MDFRDILVKASNVFPKDMYLVNNRFLLGGPKSTEEWKGQCIAILNVDTMEYCKSIYKNNDIVYFIDIKNAKDNLEEYTTIVVGEEQKKEAESMFDSLMKIKTWDSFNFTKEEKENLFNGKSIDIFKDHKKIPSLTVKNVESLVYNVDTGEDEDLGKYFILNLHLVLNYFEVFLKYKFISLTSEDEK